ncbi:MAG: hypothetical protein K8R46_04480 [Pirellulales bacterium]|nr:hypothetical protein [Pirellulales bacterium]
MAAFQKGVVCYYLVSVDFASWVALASRQCWRQEHWRDASATHCRCTTW